MNNVDRYTVLPIITMFCVGMFIGYNINTCYDVNKSVKHVEQRMEDVESVLTQFPDVPWFYKKMINENTTIKQFNAMYKSNKFVARPILKLEIDNICRN